MYTIPKAKRWEPHFCGHCPNIHVIFFDEDDIPMCDATFNIQQLKGLAELLEEENNECRSNN